MITVHEADGFGFRATFEHRRATKFQIFDEHHAIPVGEDIAVGVFHHARSIGGLRRGFARPFVTAGDAFIAFGVFQNLVRLAHRTGVGFAHERTCYPEET